MGPPEHATCCSLGWEPTIPDLSGALKRVGGGVGLRFVFLAERVLVATSFLINILCDAHWVIVVKHGWLDFLEEIRKIAVAT